MWGVLLLVAAALAGLGIYLGVAGPAGRALESATAQAVGWGRLLVTPALAVLGVTLILGRPRQVLGRILLGCLGVIVASGGLLHLSRGPSRWQLGHPGISRLADAGGLVGALVGAPLRQFLAPWGAAIVLSTVLAVSILILTGTPVRRAGQRLGGVVAAVARGIARGVRWLATIGSDGERRAAARRHPAVTSPLFDQDNAAPQMAPAPVDEAPAPVPAVAATPQAAPAPDRAKVEVSVPDARRRPVAGSSCRSPSALPPSREPGACPHWRC